VEGGEGGGGAQRGAGRWSAEESGAIGKSVVVHACVLRVEVGIQEIKTLHALGTRVMCHLTHRYDTF